MRRAFNLFINGVVDAFSHVSSNKPLFVLLIAVSIGWVAYNRFGSHPIDDWHAFFPGLVFAYTVIFGLYEGAMKIVQAAQVKRDDAARIIMQQTLVSIEDIAVSIRAELDRAQDRDAEAAERDRAAAARDEVLITLCNRMIDVIEQEKGRKS